MAKGKFITFEGGEGSGKSTQIKLLVQSLKEAGIDVLQTREPGGSPGAEIIRHLLVEGDPDQWDGLTEALLNYSARHEHLRETVQPALEAGKWVVSDRFADSTFAYQGYGHGLDLETIRRLHELVVGDFKPDLTLILDVPVDIGLSRAASRNDQEDRYERMDIEFHERVRQGFLEIAKKDPGRCIVIDASGDQDQINSEINAMILVQLDVNVT
ncbi:MAG: dTMP kinase [Rhodospirillaceae bacterium]|jgi:dTMP kinase